MASAPGLLLAPSPLPDRPACRSALSPLDCRCAPSKSVPGEWCSQRGSGGSGTSGPWPEWGSQVLGLGPNLSPDMLLFALGRHAGRHGPKSPRAGRREIDATLLPTPAVCCRGKTQSLVCDGPRQRNAARGQRRLLPRPKLLSVPARLPLMCNCAECASETVSFALVPGRAARQTRSGAVSPTCSHMPHACVCRSPAHGSNEGNNRGGRWPASHRWPGRRRRQSAERLQAWAHPTAWQTSCTALLGLPASRVMRVGGARPAPVLNRTCQGARPPQHLNQRQVAWLMIRQQRHDSCQA